MRRRLSSARGVLLSATLLASTPLLLSAQTGVAVEGALYLLLPIGAQSLGAGEAVVAGGKGSESIWWNPALIARGPREAAFNLSQPANGVITTDASAALLWSVPRVGSLAVTLRYVAEGEQSSPGVNGEVIGTFTRNGLIAAVSFAAPFGDRLAGGVTLKFLQLGAPCTGSCDQLPVSSRTAALDFGAQYFLSKDSTVAIGVSVLNLGLKLQVNDSPQADQLPTRGDMGVSFSPKVAASPDFRPRFEADLVKRLSGGNPGYRLGGEISWQHQYIGRAGYEVNGATGSGPTVGLGLATGRLRIDFAQFLTDAGTGSEKPTFLSLRYVF